jgi:hypothetical protein
VAVEPTETHALADTHDCPDSWPFSARGIAAGVTRHPDTDPAAADITGTSTTTITTTAALRIATPSWRPRGARGAGYPEIVSHGTTRFNRAASRPHHRRLAKLILSLV